MNSYYSPLVAVESINFLMTLNVLIGEMYKLMSYSSLLQASLGFLNVCI